MQPKPNFLPLFIFYFLLSVNHVSAQCCSPDSLKIKSKSDSSFCVQWRVRCDSAKGFQLQYKLDGPYAYTSVLKLYHHDSIFVFCDTGSACRSYQWRVRNVCIKNGDTVYSAWVNGAAFILPCTLKSSSGNQQNKLSVTPNPAGRYISIRGYFHGPLQLIITNLNGKEVLNKHLNISNNELQEKIDVSGFEKGFYFVAVADDKHKIKTIFLKE